MSIKYNFSLFTIFVLVVHRNVHCDYDPCDPCQHSTRDYCCQYEHKCCDVHPVKGSINVAIPFCSFTPTEETSRQICLGHKRCTCNQDCEKNQRCCFLRLCGRVCVPDIHARTNIKL
ncbi:hypothetical protein WA026_014568 [Henosepilachna vigintioctopunctata]|uniref:WAP domain-containing protein n=1 Tax=Henosepilachna vigintioctopunctata TaxID=420089 RepID=A0AAW1V9D2_9CUCU